MDTILQQLVNGFTSGATYAMLGLGQAMVYGVLRLINFAHGDIFMVGVFVGWLIGTYLVQAFAWPLLPTMLVAMVTCAFANYLVERLGYRPLRTAPRLSMLLSALAISMFLENGTQALTGTQLHEFPNLIPPTVYHWGPIFVANADLLVAVTTLLAMIVVDFLVYRTRMGKAMRAVAYNIQAAVLMGINVNAVVSWVFVVGGALAGLAGIVYGLAYPAIDPYMGLLPGLKGFVAVAIGGIGSIRGAVVGGFLLGYVETFAGGFLPSALRDAIAFFLLIVVLMIRPSGLFNVPWYTERV